MIKKRLPENDNKGSCDNFSEIWPIRDARWVLEISGHHFVK